MTPVYLRALRKRHHLSQAELAQRTGLKQNTISKLERYSNSRPLWETVLALATTFDIDPRSLRFGLDPRPPRPRRRAEVDHAEATV